MGTFSITIGPWLAVLLILAVLATVLVRRTGTRVPGVDWPALRSWIGAGVLAIALAAPMIYWATQLAKVAVAAQGPGATALIDLGNLAAPVPARAALGVWISGDYRVPSLGDTNATLLAGVVVGILALVGLGLARRTSATAALLFVGIASAVALLYFTQRTGPWIQLKAICVVGPVALALAFAGVAAIRGVGRFGQLPKARCRGWPPVCSPPPCWRATRMAFHDISLAPTDRMRDLERVGDKFAGQGPTLYPAHEEYAEYFLRKADGSAYVNPASEGSGFVGFRPDVLAKAPQPSFAFDLDTMDVQGIERYPLVVQRRGPFWSRPPVELPARRPLAVHRGVEAAGEADRAAARAGPGHRAGRSEGGVPGARPQGARRRAARPGVLGGDRQDGDRPSRHRDDRADLAQVEDRLHPDVRPRLPGDDDRRARGRDVPRLGAGPQPAPRDGDDRRQARRDARAHLELPAGLDADLDASTCPPAVTRCDSTAAAGVRCRATASAASPVGPLVLERTGTQRGAVHTAPASQAAEVCRNAEDYDWVELTLR